MNQEVKTGPGVAIIFIIVVTIGVLTNIAINMKLGGNSIISQPPVYISPKACTQEAMICSDGSAVGRTGVNCEFAECPEAVGIVDKIIVTSPAHDETIYSPVALIGRARGTWFFEGSFPVEVYDSTNKLLGGTSVQFVQKSPDDTWMTEEFVDFNGEVKFTQPKTSEGYIIFKKDNPSDMRELDEFFKLPVRFTSGQGSKEKQIGYIKKIYEKNGKSYLDIDYVEFISGDEAIKAMKADGECSVREYPDPSYCIPNDFYIRNQNPLVRTFEIAKNVQVSRATAFDYAQSGIKSISYEELKALFISDENTYTEIIPFNVEIVDGLIVKISEQYIP